MIQIGIGLSIDARREEQGLIDFIKNRFALALSKSHEKIRAGVRDAIAKAVLESPEAESLQSSEYSSLHGQLGLVNPLGVIHEIIAALQAGVLVTPIPNGVSIKASLSNLSDVLSIPSATFISERFHTVYWLQWLLTAGDTAVVQDYHYVEGPHPRSRTNLGLMYKRGSWSVPQFTGTYENNWLTRIFDKMGPDILEILNKEVAV